MGEMERKEESLREKMWEYRFEEGGMGAQGGKRREAERMGECLEEVRVWECWRERRRVWENGEEFKKKEESLGEKES